ncbi:MAG: IPT/TIG domain-containing protein [Acidimicrobiales bacterium]
MLSTVAPDAGAAGQTVVATGHGLYSADGIITATVGGETAPTSCSSETSCTITVPDLGPTPKQVTVTITTAAGMSNAVTFRYR